MWSKGALLASVLLGLSGLAVALPATIAKADATSVATAAQLTPSFLYVQGPYQSTAVVGATDDIMGSLTIGGSPAPAGSPIDVTRTESGNGDVAQFTTATDDLGNFQSFDTLPALGTYTYVISYPGNATTAPASYSDYEVTAGPRQTSIIFAGPTTDIARQPITLNGLLQPAGSGVLDSPPTGTVISITRTLAGSTNTASFTATTDVDGNFTITDTPLVAGTYTYTASYTSDNPDILSSTGSFTVTVSSAPPAVAVGVEGTNGQMYVRAPQLGGGWHSLGGQLAGPPAVAAPPNPNGAAPAQPLFIATSTNKVLYIRSLSTGWQAIGRAPGGCYSGPAAVITGSTLTVACRGADNALWENSATVLSSGLPQFTGAWASLGGVLTAAPAVAPAGGVLTFFARSTNGHVYTRTLGSGYRQMPWACTGSPAAALQAASGVTFFACQGGNHTLDYAVSSGAGWSAAVSVGGSLVGGPAVAATSGAIELFAEGTNSAVYERTPVTGWTGLGGAAVGGVAATALN
jgi:hypothetical protein